jgi:tetratricopeptide (TPR) repeat protein
MLLPLLLPLVAQASTPYVVPSTAGAKLSVCLELARTDPSTAILTASTWLRESADGEQAYAHQCMGVADMSLLRWQAAEEAFLVAHDSALPDDHALRARLAAMAGNAAIAQDQNIGALADFEIALGDAANAGDAALAGDIQVDRARALVALEQFDEAAEALANARRDSPQNPEAWLLSATLARRQEQFETAQAQIETAGGLDPLNPKVGLEAGVIAVLSGRDEAAAKSWQSVIELAPGSPEAATAKAYLAQLEEPSE